MRTPPQWKADQFAWPITVRVLVPGDGLGALVGMHEPETWLHSTLGLTEYATTPRRLPYLSSSVVEFHFRAVEDAAAFLARFPELVLADGTMGDVYSSPYLPFGRRDLEQGEMCNLYSQTRSADAMRRLFPARTFTNLAGNLEPREAIYPDQLAPVLRRNGAELELRLARWGLPTPAQYLIGKNVDRGVTNVRNTRSPHWRPWLGQENRCLVPFDRFAEPIGQGQGSGWFALRDDRPGFFAGLWVPGWISTRKVAEGEVTTDLYGFLTAAPNAEVRPIHHRAMPVILTEPDEWEAWLTAPWAEAARLQRPLADGALLLIQ